MPLYLIPFIFISVFLLLWAEFHKRQRAIYYLKPFSTILVIAVASMSFGAADHNPVYSIGILVGILFSLGGDIALMFQQNRKAFTLGLGLFLTAHIAYSVVFCSLGRSSAWDILSALILLLAGLGFYSLIRRNLGQMKWPVILYIVIISVMVNRAVAVFSSPVFSTEQARMITAGAILFYFSDVILAANRFWKPWKYQRISLALYYCGQLLIVLAGGYFSIK